METKPTVGIAVLRSWVAHGARFSFNLVIHPSATFQQVQNRSARTVFRWYLVALAFYTTMVTGMAYTGLAVAAPPTVLQLVRGYPPLHPSAFFPPVWLVFIIGSCLGTILFQTILPDITLRVVFGRDSSRGFGQSFKAIALSHTPWLIVGWIPIIGTIASVPMLLYTVIGFRELHSLSTKQAIVSVFLIPAILLLALVGAIATIVWG